MSEHSKIEWTDATWNPIRARDKATGKVGWHCVKVSPACAHCYAERQNKAGFAGGTQQPYTAAAGEAVEMYLDLKTLAKPLHWKKPRKIFVCSMTDICGDWVPDGWLDEILAVAALCPQHTFQILTKRAERLPSYFGASGMRDQIYAAMERVAERDGIGDFLYDDQWPLPNVWLGVTAEDQHWADIRLPHLLKAPAAVRFVSAEPLLGSLDLTRQNNGGGEKFDALRNRVTTHRGHSFETSDSSRIDWVIAGGESGPHARPMHPDWARSLRDQCQAAGVPFLFKQWGEWVPTNCSSFTAEADELISAGKAERHDFEPCVQSFRVGKKAAGRFLDGREWNEFPEVARA